MVIFLIDTSGADGSTAPTLPADRDDDPDAPDNPEKFHTPAADRSSVTRGCSSRNESTCRLRDMMSGIMSTPTLTALADTNGSAPNAGSSPIDTSSIDRLPDSSAR